MRFPDPFAFFAIFLVAGLALVAGAIYASHWSRRKRAEALEQAAQALNWSYQAQPGGIAAVLPGVGSLELFERGHARTRSVENLLCERKPDRPARLFDYQYVTGSGDSSRTWRQTVAAFDLDGIARLPAFTLVPETFWDWVADRFGYHDIDFDSHPEFSRRYKLRGGQRGRHPPPVPRHRARLPRGPYRPERPDRRPLADRFPPRQADRPHRDRILARRGRPGRHGPRASGDAGVTPRGNIPGHPAAGSCSSSRQEIAGRSQRPTTGGEPRGRR